MHAMATESIEASIKVFNVRLMGWIWKSDNGARTATAAFLVLVAVAVASFDNDFETEGFKAPSSWKYV